MTPHSPKVIPSCGAKKGMCQSEPVKGSDYSLWGHDRVSFAKNRVCFRPVTVDFMQIYDGEPENG
jgi:hypothetical protein